MQKSRSLHGMLEVLCLGKAETVKKSFDFGAGAGMDGQGNEDHNERLAMAAQVMMFFS